jgi:post-segregation antitoxin (ccd killing protein)
MVGRVKWFCRIVVASCLHLNLSRVDTAALESEISKLDAWIRENQGTALARFRKFSPGSSVHSFHAHIGKNNNTYVDSVRSHFGGPADFIAHWVEGLDARLNELKAAGRLRLEGRLLGEQLVLRCLEDKVLRDYTFRFLERNFYRNYRERTRKKPDQTLWSLWFGSGNLSWGLIIAPAHRNNVWTNDKSQMRRESYTYWTIGHVLATGLLDPTSSKPVTFSEVEAFATFYRSVLRRVSNSLYEQAICDRYLDYLSRSSAPLEEPLLIPEFRYAGGERKHEYRLDFTVLNGHTFQFTGFELSPASTHIRVEKASAKTQAELNKELADAWQREVSKRNAYFQTYGVAVVTFADADLKDMDACFERIEPFLRARAAPPPSIEKALASLTQHHASHAA